MGRRIAALALLLVVAAAAVGFVRGGGGGDGPTPLWQVVEKIAAARGFGPELKALLDHQEKMVRERGGSFRPLPRVKEMLARPWRVPEVARELRDAMSTPFVAKGAKGHGEIEPLVAQAARFLDLDGSAGAAGEAGATDETRLAELDESWESVLAAVRAPHELPKDVRQADLRGGDEVLVALSGFVGGCGDALAELLANASPEERRFLREKFGEFCSVWAEFNHPKPNVSDAQWAFSEKYKALSRRVDRSLLLAVSRRVARLADPTFLAALEKRLAKVPPTGEAVDGFSGDVVAATGSRASARVVLLGKGRTTITGAAALVIDLGGDDTWRRAAIVDDEATPVSVVLELGGNDEYASETPGPCYAAGGIALLVDVRGKDRYTSGRLGQAASTLGFAALVDGDGDDVYAAEDFAQGFTFCGVSLLVDRAGDDRYDAWAFAQGAGLGDGFSACIDGGGNDKYVANGHWPDVYGDSGPGSFQGLSQGYCTGMRQLRSDGVAEVEIPGGIATEIDLGDGNDFYDSGNFSQGGAYYFGFGLMYDGGGNDVNHGYRYSQGFGVHQAAGMRWDAGGNDVYATKSCANCGSAWDEGVGFLVDDAGDDQYDVGGLALGGAAETAVAVLVDGGGNDRYGGGGGNDSQGGSGAGDYHAQEGVPQSLGVLIDVGGGTDTFTRPGRDEATIATGDQFGLFVHSKEKSVAALLGGGVLQKALDAKPLPKSDKPAKPKH
jgi:hypothetical protein